MIIRELSFSLNQLLFSPPLLILACMCVPVFLCVLYFRIHLPPPHTNDYFQDAAILYMMRVGNLIYYIYSRKFDRIMYMYQ